MAVERTALVFPGQGCQYVGMGADLLGYPEACEVFAQADAILGWSLTDLCTQGPAEELNDTANTQPAVYVTSVALWRALAPRMNGLRARIAFLAGHSLGEYTALTVSGALDFVDGVRLVRARGEAMRDAGATLSGGMVAILGLDDATVAELVAEASDGEGGVWIANHNAPGQVVIAGQEPALSRAAELARVRGAKRVQPLAVSVPCHTPLMAAAAERLGAALAQASFERPWAPVVSNALAQPVNEPAALRAASLQQLTSPVRWVESAQAMAQAGVTNMIEIGPKAVVSGLVKRIAPAMALQAVTTAAELEAFQSEG